MTVTLGGCTMDNHQDPTDSDEKRKKFYLKDGKIYFDKKAERNFFFALTMLVIVMGILTKCGVFS
jgi:hypothetical protein